MATTRPLKPCTAPGCPNTVTGGRCARHGRLAGQQRTTWTNLYGRDWPRRRLEYLSRHPRCVLCNRLATVADHHPRGIKLLLRHNVDDPHADRYLRPLCGSCHSRETGKREPGGYNASRQL